MNVIVTLTDPRLAIAAEIRTRLLREPFIASLGGSGIETRGPGPAVKGVAVSLETNSIEVGVNLRLANVMEVTLPKVAARIRRECQKVWAASDLPEDVYISIQILDFDD
jgi:hypothetical protein